MKRRHGLAIVWSKAPKKGELSVSSGRITQVRTRQGRGTVSGASFAFSASGPGAIKADLSGVATDPGPGASLVTVTAEADTFTFFLRDVTAACPIWIRHLGVAVTEASDDRDYAQIVDAIRSRMLTSELDRIAQEPEETFDNAAKATRAQICETWLGLGRDMRIFAVGYNERMGYLGTFTPKNHGMALTAPENDNRPLFYNIALGRGSGPVIDITRRLDDGCLPILHGRAVDGPIVYQTTTFVTLEQSALSAEHVRGTHYLVADGHGGGHMFTEAQQAEYDRLLASETVDREEQTVLCFRAVAINTGSTPHYAFIKGLSPDGQTPQPWRYDGRAGMGLFPERGVWGINRIDGRPMTSLEHAVLIQPGEKLVFEFMMPHAPLPVERARKLARRDFDDMLGECRAFWQARLDAAAAIHVPEPRIAEMIRAGLLHLDIVAYGREPRDPVAACIGVYCPIGSESSPIIQFMDSMACHTLAERALGYFLAKQHEDGFMQNFGGYMLETGPALWSMGEHYRYTHNTAWVRRIAPQLRRACDFLLEWRNRNRQSNDNEVGRGMIEGKVADPEDHFRQFMLNGLSYLGLARVSEMLSEIDPKQSRRLAREAAAWRDDIRATLEHVMGRSPVIPLGDGSWIPTAPPWAEMRGPSALYVNEQACFTHGTFAGRDSMIGPLYLILAEVIDAHEPMGDWLVRANHELFTVRNAGFSQPYYCRHDYAHIRRGEVAAFLKLYYNQMAALADRQTYTFWEHYFGASPHKTHEEGWFLMQTRWMLWLEDGETLKLLPAVPRAWLADGQRIELNRVASYFGPVDLTVESHVDEGWISARVHCRKSRAPSRVTLRLPHPLRLKAVEAIGGRYDPEHETVTIHPFTGTATVKLRF